MSSENPDEPAAPSPDGETTDLWAPSDSLSRARSEHPAQIGPYRILDRLGEGGMGVVYLAQQEEPFRRRVAVKVIKLGMDTREVIARFEAERQALAWMDHPNVAKVHDAGATGDGRPYFAMEYVQGVPLVEYCDRDRLSIRERVALFVQVCKGVEHAHHKGIIHRDLKPSNILVSTPDDGPVAKIIDFGVAKATNQRLTERTLYTELGRAVGTPAYMSPEQAEMTGEVVDQRSDIYSLGVVLYELLVAQLPLDLDLHLVAFDELVRRIREVEPVTPSVRWSRLNVERTRELAARRQTNPQGLTTELRGDLDWVCMKAITKERARRYGTAAQLADDLERYLRGEAVEARPPSLIYRCQKYVRKNRGPVLAALAVTLTLAAGTVTSSILYWQMRWAWRETDRARIAESDRARETSASLAAEQAALRQSERLRGIAERSARVARANRLAAQSRSLLESKPQLALLLAAEAAETQLKSGELMTPECHRSLMDALAWVSGRPFLPGQRVVAVRPDLQLAVVSRRQRRKTAVALVDASDAKKATRATTLAEVGPRSRVVAKFSDDGSWLVVGDSSKLWVFRTAEPEAAQLETSGRAWALSSSGRVFAVAQRGTIRAWRLEPAGAEKVAELKGALEGFNGELLGLSADGSRLLVADRGLDSVSVAACELVDPRVSLVARRTLNVADYPRVALSPEGDRVLIADKAAVRVERVDTDEASLPLTVGPDWSGAQVALFGNAGRSVAIGCRGGRVYWWSLEPPSPTPVVLRAGSASISSLAFTADDSHLIAAGGSSVNVWNLTPPIDTNGVRYSGHDEPELGRGAIDSVTVSADSERFVSTTSGGARLWSVKQRSASPHVELLRRLSMVNVSGPYVAFSDSGNRLVTWYRSTNPEALAAPRLYDLNGASPAKSALELSAHPAGIWGAAFDATGETLLVLDSPRFGTASLVTYRVKEDVLATRDPRFDFGVFYPRTTLSPDRRWFAVLDELTVRVWDVPALAASRGHAPPLELAFEGGEEHGTLFDLVVFSAGSGWLAAYSTKAETLMAWQLEGGRFLPRLEIELPRTTGVGFSADEAFLAASDFDGRVHVWALAGDLNRGPVTLPSITQHVPGEDVLTSPDGRWLVATYRGLGGVGVFDLRTLAEGAEMTRLEGAFGLAKFDPSGRRLLTDSRRQYGRLLVWDTNDIERDPTPMTVGTMDFTLSSLAFSRSGSWLVSASSREVTVWPYGESVPGYVFPFPHTIVRQAFVSGNDRWLIVSRDGAVEAWSLEFQALPGRAREQAGRDLTPRERQRYLSGPSR